MNSARENDVGLRSLSQEKHAIVLILFGGMSFAMNLRRFYRQSEPIELNPI